MSERVFEGLDGQVRERTKTMLMYFIVFAVTMLFAGFTSAYICLLYTSDAADE